MNTAKELRKFKSYVINRQNKMEKKIASFSKEWLTVNEVLEQFGFSRKTFDRMRDNGLKISQPKVNGKILVERKEIVKFLNR